MKPHPRSTVTLGVTKRGEEEKSMRITLTKSSIFLFSLLACLFVALSLEVHWCAVVVGTRSIPPAATHLIDDCHIKQLQLHHQTTKHTSFIFFFIFLSRSFFCWKGTAFLSLRSFSSCSCCRSRLSLCRGSIAHLSFIHRQHRNRPWLTVIAFRRLLKTRN